MKRKISLLFALVFVFLTVPKVSALMGVTDVKITGKTATVVLDDYLEIAEIKILKKGVEIKIKPPIYVSKAGKIFPQAKFLNPELEKRVISAIKTGKPVGAKSTKLSYKVTKMSLYEPKKRSSLKAFSGVSFNNEVEVECKVLTGSRGLWIGWPSAKMDGRWVKQVKILKPEIQKKVEKSVLEKYEKETSYEAEIVPGGKALPVTVTDVELVPVEDGGSTKAIASIVLNNAIEIGEIEVKNVSGVTRLQYPRYTSKAGRVYPQIKILDPEVEKAIISAINKKEPSPNPSSKISYKISNYSPYTRGGSSLKVFCAVTFNNKVKIECKIMEGKWGPWVSWPARPPENGGRWINQIEVKDKKLKKVVEQALVKRYETETGSKGKDEAEDDDYGDEN
ncbi:MAG: septation protein SpoVG family protein [bacterium]